MVVNRRESIRERYYWFNAKKKWLEHCHPTLPLIGSARATSASVKVLRVTFKLVRDQRGPLRVQFSAEGGDVVEEDFAFDPTPSSLVALNLEALEASDCDLENLKYAGYQLWLGLMSGRVGAAFNQVYAGREEGARIHLRLFLPAQPLSQAYPVDLRALPWEALCDEDGLGLLTTRSEFCILREPATAEGFPAPSAAGQRSLRMLVIIPDGSGLNTAHELENIRQEGQKLGSDLELETLVGTVDRGRLLDTFRQGGPWDIVHFIGHGGLDDRKGVTVEINDASGAPQPMDGEQFALCLAAGNCRLAVLNCCHGATSRDSRRLSGLGPLLNSRGIPAVVAMRYAIEDPKAILFAKTFYRSLFCGSHRGRVDVAVEDARSALRVHENPGAARSFITPILHLAAGYEQLFDLGPAVPSPPPSAPPPPPPPGARALPATLEAAFRDRRCVPILGPGILVAGAVRRAGAGTPAIPGPTDLATSLSQFQSYPYPTPPGKADFALCANGGDWMSGHLLQWVCQHFQHKAGNRTELLMALGEVYGRLEPGEFIRQVANWRVPAMFYTFFDGLLEQCVNRRESSLNVVAPLSPSANPSEGEDAASQPLLLVRGSLNDPDSLVLTEEDFDDLLDRLSRLPPTVAALTKRTGRSVLFLGLNPRDPLVRALAHKLLETGSRRKQGPTFFVAPTPTDVDRAYWDRYHVTWIDEPVDRVIHALSHL